jgi:hypothetical protein
MAKTHVAEILIGGKNPDELVMKRLKEKDTILNKEKLNSSVSRTSYVTLEGDFFKKNSLNFTKINSHLSEEDVLNKHALVYYFDVTKSVGLKSQISAAEEMLKKFQSGREAKPFFIVAHTKDVRPTPAELKNITRLKTTFSADCVYTSQSQSHMTKLKIKLLEFVQERVKKVESDTQCASDKMLPKTSPASFGGIPNEQTTELNAEQHSNSSLLIAIPETVAFAKSSLEAQKTVLTQSLSSSSISSLETIESKDLELGQPPIIAPTTTDNRFDDLEIFIEHFRTHYVEQNKNSTGINKMMQRIEKISKTSDTNQGEQIVAIMAEVSKERLTSVRSFWSNSSFFGKGRSKDAKELYQMCAKKDVTFDELMTLVSRNGVISCQRDS